MTGGIISYMGHNYPLQHAIGSAATGGDREMVAAVTGYKHRVIGMVITGGSTSNTVKSGSTAISSALGATAALVGFPINQHGYFETAASAALNLTPVGSSSVFDVWYITILAS